MRLSDKKLIIMKEKWHAPLCMSFFCCTFAAQFIGYGLPVTGYGLSVTGYEINKLKSFNT